MDIEGTVALVTGANRGLGRAYAQALIEAGAAKVYAGARDPSSIDDERLVAVQLDVTDPEQVKAAAEQLTDVTLVINNAGVANPALPLDATLDGARHEYEVNVLGTLSVTQAFAPVLAANGGGALVNILSVASFRPLGMISTYSASKAAAWSLTNALREQLREQDTLVVGVHAGFIDTDLAANVPPENKIPPSQVVEATLQALADGDEEVLADDISREAKAALSA